MRELYIGSLDVAACLPVCGMAYPFIPLPVGVSELPQTAIIITPIIMHVRLLADRSTPTDPVRLGDEM